MDNDNDNDVSPKRLPLKQIYQLENASKEEILEKYEEILYERETQIRELAYQMGIVNEQLYNSCEKLKKSVSDKEEVTKRINKKDNHIRQELNDKEIMYTKLNVLVNENDKLKKIIQSSSTDVSLFSDSSRYHNKRGHSQDKSKSTTIASNKSNI